MSIYFEPGLMRQVAQLAAKKRWTKSSVIEAAVASFFSADSAERQEAALSRRLDRIGRQLERLERGQRVETEALAVFVRHWLVVTPPLPASAQPAARASGRDRYQAFVEAVAREMAKGGGLLAEIQEDVGPRAESE
ncbi:CopG family transcriptional regulator [Caulobacter sp. KR2-114]|uniref:CopG family transcriptional regulator n=1 Tax=Caulobacter sp. KR2-114 TaxID=3400912 RepID=UPI003BFCC685